MSESKSLIITISISAFLFLFISFFLYIVYSYEYYDDYQKELLTDNFNSKKYDSIYENLYNKELSKEDLIKSINFLYDKNKLTDIYNEYYQDTISLDDFLNKYYYGNNKINVDDIDFIKEGETNLFKRAKYYYDKINLISKGNYKTSIGVIEEITLTIEQNSSLKVDGKEINCSNGICLIDRIYGGIYEINYYSNGFTYYGLLNISASNELIDITNLDSLIKI